MADWYTPGVRLASTPRGPRLSRSAVILALYGSLALFAVGLAAWRGDPNLYRLEGISTPRRLVLSPFIGTGFGLAMVFLSRWAVHRFDWARVLHREFHAVVHELSSREILVLAIASSVGEELFFRGALQPAIGLVPAAVLFAAMHMRPHLRFLPWTIMSLMVGLAMGVLFRELGDLGGPIAAHFTINLLNLQYIARTELSA